MRWDDPIDVLAVAAAVGLLVVAPYMLIGILVTAAFVLFILRGPSRG